MSKQTLIGQTLEQLSEIVKDLGEPKFRTQQLHSWIYTKTAREFDEMTNLSKSMRALYLFALTLLLTSRAFATVTLITTASNLKTATNCFQTAIPLANSNYTKYNKVQTELLNTYLNCMTASELKVF